VTNKLFIFNSGTVRRRWRPTSNNKKAEVELVLQANYVEVCNSQRSDVVASAPDVKECFSEFWSKFDACPLKGRDQILTSVCPQVNFFFCCGSSMGSIHEPTIGT
jgi:DNA helicase MCM9